MTVRTIDAQFAAVLDAVAAAPPPRFSGGGKWEAMHGTMGGWYEIRRRGPAWPNAMDLSVFDVVGVSGAGGGREAVLVTERDAVPGAVVARAWR